MSELGRHLKEARLQKGMSLDDVQEVTKIRKKYLEAIEAGDYKVLPGSFYVRAFIKTYAEAVGVNPDELMEEHGNVPAAPVDTTMETVIQKRSRRTETERNAKWLPTVLMWTFPVLIIAVIYWYASSNMNDSDPKTVDSSNVTNEQQDPSKIQPSPTAVGGGLVSNPPAGGDSTATASASPTVAPTATPAPSPTNAPVTVTEDRKSGKTTIFKVSAPSGAAVEVKIAASGTSWLEVYNGENSQGEKLSFGNTAAGDSLSFTLGAGGMYIKSGYSPATTITVNGQEITDGKTSSRLLLELDNSASGGTAGTDGAEGTESNSGE
ncbi:helix-turn-helix domain-containing protein [Paenibacillus sp. FSL R7-0331]|uniref:helix-turn-helix domain-containing protein n=1 Tax=Paenibacillus sp. FSL R7-0331 TaxID=1536773 RepID=UPI0004F6DFEC|nr:RodZ family helix-turn-helix domain-containing protein [Paenibacillus sp. FSL R7-0331]AIQ53260.1 hypothetical protein R70331_18150 [Paenibacillus sp. FSL R7-0331]